MNILLINTNPVVSRLLALCTRDAHMVLDEVGSVDAVERSAYDIVFVDEALYTDNMVSLLEGMHIRKKVLLSYTEALVRGFDQTVKKPFLPSQIIKILAETESAEAAEEMGEAALAEPVLEETEKVESTPPVPYETIDESDGEEVLPEISALPGEEETAEHAVEEQAGSDTKVLNLDEIAKIKALLDMEENEIEINEDDLLEGDAYEARKIKVIKEQLIADGLEIVEEDEMVESLSASAEKDSETLHKILKKIKKKHKKKRALDDEERLEVEKALHAAIAALKPKKIKKLLNGEEIKVKIKLEDRSS
ncbi:MAG TPA: hypothetical protein VIM88_08390 [Sulfurovum sp.]|uniref:hypothetical protein n=1 Tax=Sulfurovum sp. TaxID=1969726 RepID=UPI002F941567